MTNDNDPPPSRRWHAATRPVSLPYPSLGTQFLGRSEILSRIHAVLRQGGGLGVSLTTQVIQGTGGIGKTRTAVEYAWAYQDQYTALLFLNAETPQTLADSLAGLATPLGLATPGANDTDASRAAVLAWLAANPGWLIILDNVDTEAAETAARAVLSRLQGGHALLTSRRQGLAVGIEPITLDALDSASATDFLLTRTGSRAATPTDQQDAATLAKELDGLPLALERAAATIQQRAWSFGDYLRAWRTERESLASWHAPEIKTYRQLDPHLAVAIAALSPGARWLLEHLAFLAPDPIPDALLDVPVPGMDAAAVDIRTAPEELAALSLVTRHPDTATLTVHPLVQDGMRQSLPEDVAKERLAETLAWMDAAFDGDPMDARTWKPLSALAPHAATVATRADAAGITVPTADVMTSVGNLFLAQSLYSHAEPLLRRALAINETRFGSDSPEIAIHLNNLAQLLQATNRLGQAEPLMRRALAIDEASYGNDHPSVAIDLNNLAQLLQDTNRLDQAEKLMRRALAMDEASYGKDHPDVARDLNNLAQLLKATNRLDQAEKLMRRALAIDEASYGNDHPSVAIDLNNLAALLQATNRLDQAEKLMRRALAVDEASYGKDHPSVAIRLNNLAQLLHATNRLDQAEPLMRRALAIDEASYGKDHPRVAIHLNNLAQLLQATNRLNQAEPLMRRALAIDEASYGNDHPNVAIDLNNLAQLLQATNRLDQAEPLMRRHLATFLTFQRTTGHPHPHRNTAINNYATLLTDMGKTPPEITAALQTLEREAGLTPA